MNAKTCKYIDKDKILPSLEKRRRQLIESCFEETMTDRRMDLLQLADEIGKIIENIELGIYDWNQGSE